MTGNNTPSDRAMQIFTFAFLSGTVLEVVVLLLVGIPVWIVGLVAVASIISFVMVLKNLRRQRERAEDAEAAPGTIEY